MGKKKGQSMGGKGKGTARRSLPAVIDIGQPLALVESYVEGVSMPDGGQVELQLHEGGIYIDGYNPVSFAMVMSIKAGRRNELKYVKHSFKTYWGATIEEGGMDDVDEPYVRLDYWNVRRRELVNLVVVVNDGDEARDFVKLYKWQRAAGWSPDPDNVSDYYALDLLGHDGLPDPGRVAEARRVLGSDFLVDLELSGLGFAPDGSPLPRHDAVSSSDAGHVDGGETRWFSRMGVKVLFFILAFLALLALFLE